MAADQPGKCSMIRQIVRIRQMLRRWRLKAAASRQSVPADVPAGHIAVAVGSSGRRFVVRATHLNHPVFHSLLDQAEEEFGSSNRVGPLVIPCEEMLFEEIIRFVSRTGSTSFSRSRSVANLEDFKRNCHSEYGIVSESRPLISRKTVY